MKIADERRDKEGNSGAGSNVVERHGRISKKDLLGSSGPVEERGDVLFYVCGPPALTDWAVDELKGIAGVDKAKVLCEKWW